MSRRDKLLLFDLVLLVAWVVGLRLILGEWDWGLTGIGAALLVARMVWDARPRRRRDDQP